MKGETKERWLELAQLASVEQDPAKLLALTQEINQLLEDREERIRQKRSGLLVADCPVAERADTAPDSAGKFSAISAKREACRTARS
jgi:hypothetical protein